jgi:hypothetical protein
MSGRTDPDDELLAELRSLLRRVDPAPLEVSDFAKAALGWRRLDADLAELLADSALETAAASGIRSGESARRLTFGSSGHSIDLEVQPDDGSIRLLGQIAPPPAVATIEVQGPDGAVAASVAADTLGRFKLELAERGRVRLRVLLHEPAGPPIETSWISL